MSGMTENEKDKGKKINKKELEMDIGAGLYKVHEIVNAKQVRVRERDLLKSELVHIENAIEANNNKITLSKEEKLKEKCYLEKVKCERMKTMIELNKTIAQMTKKERNVSRGVDRNVVMYFSE